MIGISMKSIKNPQSKHVVIKESNTAPKFSEVGLILVDSSLTIIASDPGAAAILNQAPENVQMGQSSSIPNEIREILRNPADLPLTTCLCIGENSYTCRAYLVEAVNGFLTHSLVAVHLERVSPVEVIPSVSAAVAVFAAKYQLTPREQQALVGISMGLSSKELAERMTISPNTVKVFLRLIMIKMGVTTRGGIVARILEYQTNGEQRVESAAAARSGAG